jgi:SAM-dependent methyltransferase
VVGDIGDHNRERFDDPASVADYLRSDGLTPCETALFEAHVPAGSRVLDLGIGTGRTTGWLADRGSTYVGIDYAPRMVEAARDRHPGRDLRVADAADLSDLEADSFDVVVFSFNGIDYLDDRARAACLDACARVLAPGGRLILSSHNPRALVGRAGPGVQGTARRLAVGLLATLRRTARLLPTRAFRTGEGWVRDPVKGGLETHMATPARMTAELAAHGFAVDEVRNGDLPAAPSAVRTPWWYVVARPDGSGGPP